MNEIEKLYKKVGIKKKYCGRLDMGDLDCQMQYVTCNSINEWKEAVFSSRFGETEEEPKLKYPEFTAEKQLEIEGVIFRHNFGLCLCELRRDLGTEFNNKKFVRHYFEWSYMARDGLEDDYIEYSHPDRAIALAGFVNKLWHDDLTDEEKKQIKDILK